MSTKCEMKWVKTLAEGVSDQFGMVLGGKWQAAENVVKVSD